MFENRIKISVPDVTFYPLKHNIIFKIRSWSMSFGSKPHKTTQEKKSQNRSSYLENMHAGFTKWKLHFWIWNELSCMFTEWTLQANVSFHKFLLSYCISMIVGLAECGYSFHKGIRKSFKNLHYILKECFQQFSKKRSISLQLGLVSVDLNFWFSTLPCQSDGKLMG